MRTAVLSVALLAAAPAASQALVAGPGDPLSDQVRRMIEAAYQSGDDATIKAVVGVAKATFPEDAAEIDRLAAGDAAILAISRREEQEKAQARIAAATFFEIWKGEVEVGASRSTGTTRQSGLYGAAALTRDGLRWRQRFNARADIQQTNRVTTTERLAVSYQPNYKVDDQLYIYGIGQYEHDRFLGYAHRGTLGPGLGYTAVSTPTLKIDLEGGPAARRTIYYDHPNETRLAGRGSLVARWAISPTLTLNQNAAIYLEDNTSATSTTTVDTKLIGNLKARLSYNVQYETRSFDTDKRLDTLTRATLVYSF